MDWDTIMQYKLFDKVRIELIAILGSIFLLLILIFLLALKMDRKIKKRMSK